MYHKRVNKNTAKNPIARAVARRLLEESIVDHKIKLYLLKKGDLCAEECNAIGTAMSVLAFAAEMDPNVGPEDPAVRVVRGAISACHQMAEADSYDPANTVALDRGLDAAFELNRKLKPDLITKAWDTLVKFAIAK